MRINIISVGCNISPHYLETLVLLFLPREKFSEKEKDLLELEITCNSQSELYGRLTLVRDGVVHNRQETSYLSYYPDVISDKIKVFVGSLFLSLFSEVFSYFPPWGMMTGVRPARFAFDIISRTQSDSETFDILRKFYLVSEEKAKIAVDIANIDKKIVSQSESRECSIYVSIPFCPTRCKYCSFVSYSTPRLLSMLTDYLRTLVLELETLASFVREHGFCVRTIYVGGGTPTVLAANDMNFLLSHIADCFDVQNLLEFTYEAGRPDTLTSEKLELMKRFGVTRISINTQTTNDKILRSIGRNHTFSDFREAFTLARKCGFDNINTDLIAGLPGESFVSFCNSVNDVIELSPENITVHSFSLKKSSEFTTSGGSISSCNSLVSDMIEFSSQKMSEFGFSPYYIYRQKNTEGNTENTGYCKDDKYGLYNIYMMEELHSVFSVGAGCSSMISNGDFSNVKKFYNPKYPYEYLRNAFYLQKYENEIKELLSKF